METKANYVLVGVFTIVVLVLSFGFVYWSANVSDQKNQVQMLVRIQGSVTGLSKGSQVLFNGLKVGDVRDLKIDPNDPRTVIATTLIDATTPVTPSTRATIGFQGLTGLGFIELKGGDTSERNIIEYAREQGAVPIIQADPSDVTDILATAKDISERANNILAQFESVVDDIGPSVRTTASNISKTSENVRIFTQGLADNSGQINSFLASAGHLADTATKVAEALPGAIDSAKGILDAVDPKSVSQTVGNVAAISQTFREQSDNIASVIESVRSAASSVGAIGETISRNTPGIDRFIANLGPISDTAKGVATKLDTTLSSTNQILAAVDPAIVSKTIGDISHAAGSVSDVAGLIGDQRDAIGQIVGNVTGISRNFNGFSEMLSKNEPVIDRFIADLGPISDDATSAASSIRAAADKANQMIAGLDQRRISETVDNVADLVAGIRAKTTQIQALIDGADTTVRTIGNTVQGFNGTREKVDQILSGIDPATVTRTMTNVSSATDNVARAADSVASIANDIGARREDINRIITDSGEITAKVNTASTRLDTVLASLDRLLRADSTEGLAAEASATLKTFRETAQSIQARIGPIADNIQSFSGNGLNEVRSLVRDVTRSVNRIEGAVTDFQANPSRLIFGGEEVKQYDGRNRR